MERVKKEQDMVEIMTDKVNINVPSPVEGKVNRILFKDPADNQLPFLL